MNDIIVKDGIKQEHIDFLLDYYDKNCDKLVSRNAIKPKPSRLSGKALLENKFEEIYNIINSIVSCERQLSFSFNVLSKPCALHIDGTMSFLADDRPVRFDDFNTIILLPLRVYPDENKISYAYTVFFDQKSTDNKWVNHKFVTRSDESTRMEIENYTNNPFEEKDHRRWLNHTNIDSLHGFSIKEQIKWKAGRAIISEPSRFHGSAIYHKIDKKLCLVIKAKTNLFRVVSSEAVRL